MANDLMQDFILSTIIFQNVILEVLHLFSKFIKNMVIKYY